MSATMTYPSSSAPSDALAAAAAAGGFLLTGVVSGCAVTPQGIPNMTVAVAAGTAKVLHDHVYVTAGSVAIGPAHATLRRIDLVVADAAGALSVIAGVPAQIPTPPTLPTNRLLLASVAVGAGVNAIGLDQIKDRRVMLAPGIDTVFNVADYGPIGPGVDGYAALAAAVADLNAAGAGTLVIPPTVVKQDRYVTATNGVTDITITGCDGVRVIGYGATIEVKGDIYRNVVTTRTLIGLKFQLCTRVTVEGLEIDGNADQATKANVTEAASHNLAFYGCVGITLKNLNLHHSTCDGLYFDEYMAATPQISCQNATVESVICKNNARQGMSITQLRKATFKNCDFNDSGLTGGSYGGHAPMAGVDIEPIRDTPTVDVRCGHITFDTCEFRNNQGKQFSAVNGSGGPFGVEWVRIVNSDIIADTSTSQFVVILAAHHGTLEDSYISCTNPGQPLSAIYPYWFTGSQHVWTVIRNNEIRGKTRCIVATGGSPDNLVIEGNDLISETAAPTTTVFLQIQTANTSFRDNKIFIPAAAHAVDGAALAIASLTNLDLVEKNVWNTDLVPTTTEHFYIDYSGTARVANERFKIDPSKPFRPAANATWDVSIPYGLGIANSAAQLIFVNTNNDRGSIKFGTAAPTTGTHEAGEVVLNSNPSAAGQPFGWVCIAGGTPGTWNVIASIGAT